MVATGSSTRRYGLRSGHIKAKTVTVNDVLTVRGNLSFGDASTDALVVTGLSTFSATMDVNTVVDIDTTTTATNAIVDIAQTGTGQVLRVDQNSTTSTNIAFEIDDESTGAKNLVKIAGKSTGTAIQINCESTTGAAVALAINSDSTDAAAYALDIDSESTGAVINLAASATTVPIIALDASSFQAVTCTTATAERVLVKTGTNTRYIQLYSG